MGSRSDGGTATSTGAPGTALVVVTGAAGELGRRVCRLLDADPGVTDVLALDRRSLPNLPPRIRCQRVDLETADLKPLLEGASTVIHLAQPTGPSRGDAISHPTGEGRLAARVLEAAGAVGADHVVLLSSAAAYGAWANNPVPLTEDAPLRPNPGVAMATEKAEMERAAADWRDDHPGSRVVILRPTVTLTPGANGWLARALDRSTGLALSDEEPPAQFLDMDDLAAAVDLSRRQRLDGPRNVAPDGWISGDTVRDLAGGVPRLRLPERLALRVSGLRWRWGLSPTPPELLPYTVHSWVIANDRLKAEGWEPSASNEEAYVAAHRAGPWATLSPSRRQEVALGVAGATILATALGAASLVRRRRSR